MEYEMCRKCTFWVEKKTKLCPNCGVLYPTKETRIQSYAFKGGMIGAGLMFSLYALGYLIGYFTEEMQADSPVLMALFFSLLTGYILGIPCGAVFGVIRKGYLKVSEVKFLNHPYLIKDEQKIGQRQNDLRIKERKISEAMEQLEESFKLVEKPTEQLELAKKTLQNALDAVLQQKNGYKIKLWEIKLLRWHNPLKPLTIKINSDINPGQEQYDSYLSKLKVIRNKGKVLLTEIQQLDVFDKEKSENYITQLSNGLEAINELITEIVERQAALDVQDAIKGVSFIQESFPAENPMIESTIAQVSCLDALLPDLDTLSSDLDKLEEAYFRLEAEKEIKREFS